MILNTQSITPMLIATATLLVKKYAIIILVTVPKHLQLIDFNNENILEF